MARMRAKQEEIELFRQLIRTMSRDSLVYKMLKRELRSLGHWKNRPGGRPASAESARRHFRIPA